ncbi:hypothetical protein Cfor_01426 [Coptotermes formosanus]|uniref:Lipase domain-containing protein n=1 Tax=Coptotermes formosanus TaxID=36987 RepID=A0A6L2Q5R5_COPFO|nr:hypothetical protein Cfor_01426 [Coptotermes formosanus]
MAAIACALLTLAMTLPAGLQLEIAGVNIGSAPLSEQQTLLWHSMLNEIMEEMDHLDDTIFEEGEEPGITYRNEIPEAVDCFGLPILISRALRFLFTPDRKETVNTRYFLSTRLTCFIGCAQEDVNVIVVDWSGGGGSWMYWRAVANTRVTGLEVTKLIRKLIEAGLKTKSIHLIGHSLGAHICSYAGSNLGGVGRITGLDPAQPCFQADSPDIRLDPSDADFIDVIHTNGRVLEKVGLGLPDPIGHVDFYPNGGAKQPGCSKKRNKLLFPITSFIKNSANREINLQSWPFLHVLHRVYQDGTYMCLLGSPLGQNDAKAATLAPCNVANCTAMGIAAEIFPARGTFYVATQANTPYCIQDPKTDSEMIPAFFEILYGGEGQIDLTSITLT